MELCPRHYRWIAALIIVGLLITFNAWSGGLLNSNTNEPDSVRATSFAGMQWESFLENKPGRRWAEKIIGYPMERPISDIGPVESQFNLIFSVLVPTDWVVSDQLTKIHTLHPRKRAPNIYRIYIKGDQFYFSSAGHHYYAPIRFGQEQTFYVNCRMAYADSEERGWIEVFLDQVPTGSSNPLPGQFVPRHTVSLPNGELNPYLQIGLDTLRAGMPKNVPYRRLYWSLKELRY
jgi:hypothetical protein